MPSSIPFPLGNSCHNCRNIPSSSLCPADGNLGVRKSISAFQSHIPLRMQGTNSNFHAKSSEAFRESPAAFAAGGSCGPWPPTGLHPVADTADKTNKLTDTSPGFEFFALQKIQSRTRRRHLAGRGDRGAKRPRPPEAASRQNPNSGWTMPNSSSPSGGGT